MGSEQQWLERLLAATDRALDQLWLSDVDPGRPQHREQLIIRLNAFRGHLVARLASASGARAAADVAHGPERSHCK